MTKLVADIRVTSQWHLHFELLTIVRRLVTHHPDVLTTKTITYDAHRPLILGGSNVGGVAMLMRCGPPPPLPKEYDQSSRGHEPWGRQEAEAEPALSEPGPDQTTGAWRKAR